MNKNIILASTYPLLGIFYFATHSGLYATAIPVITKALATSLGITIALFFFTYVPQMAFCALFSGPLAFIPAMILVLGESYFLSMFVAKTWLLGPAQDTMFDAVLLQQGNTALVERGREVRMSNSGIKVLGKPLIKALEHISKDGFVRYIVTLPLNSIPFVGTLCFLYYNGLKSGPKFHERYFELKRWDSGHRRTFVEKNRVAYTVFGAVALALNLVPVVGSLFTITNTVGAALWASKLEGHTSDMGDRSVPVVIEANE